MSNVEYCLVSPTEQHCTVEMVQPLLGVVVFCNAVKCLTFLYLVFLQFEPLITMGSAVASFLERPDATTAGLGAYTARDVRGKWISDPQSGNYWSELNQDNIYKPERRRWFSGGSPTRWAFTMIA